MNFFFDKYSLQARVVPVLLTILPLIVLAVGFFINDASRLQFVTSSLLGCGVFVLFANTSRPLGQKKQKQLFRKWGGSATFLMLDSVTSTFSSNQLNKIHYRLELLTGELAPQTLEEKKTVYETWTAFLRNKTRDQQTPHFRLILVENINYGFRRNLLGMKWIGIAITIVSLGLVLLHIKNMNLPLADYHSLLKLNSLQLISILIIVSTGLWFLFVVTENWVKMAAMDYAKCLLEAVDVIPIQHDAPIDQRKKHHELAS